MKGLTPFNASCLFGYTNGQVYTIGKGQSSETCLRIDLEESIEYASIRKTILRGYTLTKWTRAIWMSSTTTGQAAPIWQNLTIFKSIWSGLRAGEKSKW